MDNADKLFEIHAFCNLTRFIFLKLENRYSRLVEKTNITLPQLRILWIISIFPGISSGKIAKLGCWTHPTVTKMLKILKEKDIVYNVNGHNKKSKAFDLTPNGHYYIQINKQTKGNKFPLYELMNIVDNNDLSSLIEILKSIILKFSDASIFEYIEKINALSLKIKYDDFTEQEQCILKNIVWFYNLLRIFVLTTENEHNLLLKKLNLTYPQLRALTIFKAFPGIISSELSQIAIWSPSTANLVVKHLYKKDLIFKEKGSVKNSIHIYLTEYGKAVVNDDFKANLEQSKIIKILDSFSTERLKNINRILYALNAIINNEKIEEYIARTFDAS